MRFYLITFIVTTLFCSCKQSAIRQNFSSADSLVVHFKDEQAGTITKTVQTANSKAINRIIEFIDAKETVLFECGYDGKMFFYSKGQKMQEVDFKMKNDSCNHFTFSLKEKRVATKMSVEAVDFLDALEKGLPTYY